MSVGSLAALSEIVDAVTAAVHDCDERRSHVSTCRLALAVKRKELEEATSALRREVEEAEAALGLAEDDLRFAERQLQTLVAPEQFDEDAENDDPVPLDEVQEIGVGDRLDPFFDQVAIDLDDPSIPKKWKIAFVLLANPRLDYQRTAARVCGPSTAQIAKNRVNGHVTILKTLGVIRRTGPCSYRVDRTKLAELSGLPVPPESTEVPS